eukprot:Plantae.Rhodophyta-Purpureofilum_apyrenoidigerum.ctg21697.p2 GENE.Plantae.Rhodophyta-Purpureofilum_apyrenoidigerum.ctg21697~~Plantae.Rhodophyta-Purpureofilum_apyrenoidigerum.ctg21697.p2  ORF type:complete len:141 (+),score=20.22 Plantae.Rhodophyta-Purpureofilum_apyrenoidigerum.ctg21697:192-614(+)
MVPRADERSVHFSYCSTCAGFGDACIFLHDRGNYKSGWQLEKEWEDAQKKKSTTLRGRSTGVVEETETKDQDKKLPFACFICRNRFVKPVVTLCSHYFDEKCALERFAKDPTCAICGKDTKGSFNVAKKVLADQKKTLST